MAGIPAVVKTTTVATSGNGTTATVQLNRAPMVAINDKVIISGVQPAAYNGQFTVTALSNTAPYSVSFASAATGSMTSAGTFAKAPAVNAQGGGSSVYTNTATTTAATTETVTLSQAGASTTVQKYYATLTLDSALNVGIGSTISVTGGMTPTGYKTTTTGVTGVVTGVSDIYPYSVTYEVKSALGAQTAAGTVTVTGTHFDSGDYGTVGKSANLLSNNTQSNVQTFYQTSQNSALVAKRNSLFDGLDPNLPLPVALLKAIGQTLVQGAIDTATTVGQVLAVVGSWISGAINSAGKIIGDIATAVVDVAANTVGNLIDFLTHVFNRGTPGVGVSTGKTVNDLTNAANAVTGVTYLTNYSTKTHDDFWNTPRVLPNWLGGTSDDVSFAQSFIDTTEAPALGRLVLIPVTVTQNRTFDSIKFGMSVPGGGATMTYCWAALYDVDETTGAATKIIDLGNVKSSLNGNYSLQTIPLGQSRALQQGEIYYIGIVQEGGTACALHKWSATNNFTTGRYPKFIGSYYQTALLTPSAVTPTPGLPESFVQTELLAGSKYWGAIGLATPSVTAPSMYFSDTFNRTTGLGSSWTQRYGTTTVSNSFSSSSGSLASYNGRLATTVQEGGFVLPTVYSPSRGSSGQSAFEDVGLIGLRGNGGGKFVYLRVSYKRTAGNTLTGVTPVYSISYSIYTATSYSSVGADLTGGTFKAGRTLYSGSSYTSDFTNPSSWSFKVSTSGSTSTYSVFKDGVQQATSWVDTNSTGFPFNTSNTEVLLGGYSAALYNWYAKDV
jgi:hypothetical protein